MAQEITLLDTSVLIDFFRKQDKSKSVLFSLSKHQFSFAVSTVTEFEIYSGATSNQVEYWNTLIKMMTILAFDSECARVAVSIQKQLKTERKQIDIADLFIASIAIRNNIKLSTLNTKHFERIKNLTLI